ncbi:MAG: hypothetical protein O7D86_07415 [Proteobacteria bacterium]|nr:hypothetical protein [Pseudomonadota bacterium]
MKPLNHYKILLTIISFIFIFINPIYADSLGRLYTSADERIKLEQIRHAKPKPEKIEVVKVEEIIEPVMEEKEIVIRDAITLKGIVHRKNGKSVAWINDSNTFEGDLESQFIQVPGSKINSDQVTIIMPDDSTSVELKVGQSFEPTNEKNIEIIVQPESVESPVPF